MSTHTPPSTTGLGTASGADLATKYQRLAGEYAKLRAQVSVLKQGVVDERTKSARLEDGAAEMSIALRRLESEREALVFRNEQLTRRVETLQGEMETKQRGKHTGKKSEVAPSHREQELELRAELLEKELTERITQNERLYRELSAKDEAHAAQLVELDREWRKLGEEETVKKKASKTTTNPFDIEEEGRFDQFVEENENHVYVCAKCSGNCKENGGIEPSTSKIPPVEGELQIEKPKSVRDSACAPMSPPIDAGIFPTVSKPESTASLAALVAAETSNAKVAELTGKLEQLQVELTLARARLEAKDDKPKEENVAGKSGPEEDYFLARLDAVSTSAHRTETLAAYYKRECATLLARLRLADVAKIESIDREKRLAQRVEILEEEAASLAKGYEQQLHMLSDRLADMHEAAEVSVASGTALSENGSMAASESNKKTSRPLSKIFFK